jgi:hypothetical protein
MGGGGWFLGICGDKIWKGNVEEIECEDTECIRLAPLRFFDECKKTCRISQISKRISTSQGTIFFS